MVVVAQSVESRNVNPEVAGSIPVVHPKHFDGERVMKREPKRAAGARQRTLQSPLLGKGCAHGKRYKVDRRDERMRLHRGDWNDPSASVVRFGDSARPISERCHGSAFLLSRADTVSARVRELAGAPLACARLAAGARMSPLPTRRAARGAAAANRACVIAHYTVMQRDRAR